MQLLVEDSYHTPYMVLAGDFNLPDISWDDCEINSSPSYGLEINQFLDSINNNGLEQLVLEPTQGKNVLDLIFCSRPHIISNINIVPGMSDHEAIVFNLNAGNKRVIEDNRRSIFQYHKVNLEGLKAELLYFQNEFLTSHPYSASVEANWTSLKHAINEAMEKYIPKSTNDLPWLTHSIKNVMK